MLRWVVLVSVLVACVSEHHSDDSPHDHHTVRDPATQPCDASNWRALFPDLRQCELGGQQLDGESLRRADLTESRMAAATFVGADLFKAVFVGAVLTNVDLRGAKLTSSDFTNADLTNTSFVGATLTNAIFTNASRTGAVTDETTICPLGTPGPCW